MMMRTISTLSDLAELVATQEAVKPGSWDIERMRKAMQQSNARAAYKRTFGKRRKEKIEKNLDAIHDQISRIEESNALARRAKKKRPYSETEVNAARLRANIASILIDLNAYEVAEMQVETISAILKRFDGFDARKCA